MTERKARTRAVQRRLSGPQLLPVTHDARAHQAHWQAVSQGFHAATTPRGEKPDSLRGCFWTPRPLRLLHACRTRLSPPSQNARLQGRLSHSAASGQSTAETATRQGALAQRQRRARDSRAAREAPPSVFGECVAGLLFFHGFLQCSLFSPSRRANGLPAAWHRPASSRCPTCTPRKG
jgi:hypothetical protein